MNLDQFRLVSLVILWTSIFPNRNFFRCLKGLYLNMFKIQQQQQQENRGNVGNFFTLFSRTSSSQPHNLLCQFQFSSLVFRKRTVTVSYGGFSCNSYSFPLFFQPDYDAACKQRNPNIHLHRAILCASIIHSFLRKYIFCFLLFYSIFAFIFICRCSTVHFLVSQLVSVIFL